MADGPLRATPGRTFVLAAVIGAIVALAVFHGGGSGSDTTFAVGPAVSSAVGVLAVCICFGLVPVVRPGRAGWYVIGGLALLAVWVGLSLAWSITPDASWDWLNRSLVVLGFVFLGLVLAGLEHGGRAVVALLTVVTGVAVGWALLGVVVPSLAPNGDRVARLSEPVGYWNALALLCAMALVLGLALAASPASLFLRVTGSALVYGSAIAMLMTQSRAGALVAIVMVAVWLRRSRRRLDDAVRLVLAAIPAVVVAGWAFTRSALVDDDVGRAARVHDGKLFAVALIVGFVVVVLSAVLVPVAQLVSSDPRRVKRALLVVLAALVLFGAVVLVAGGGGSGGRGGDEITIGACENSPGRFRTLCDNNRLAWWRDAVRIARDHPLAGTGAGTYAIARLRVRSDSSTTKEPHSLPFQLLADLGLVGLALGVVAASGAVGVSRRALRNASAATEDATTLLVAVTLGWGLHALVDYDADFLAVTAPAALALGSLIALSVGEARRLQAGISWAIAAVAVCVGAVGSLALPELASRAVDRGTTALEAGDLETAARKARDARSLNPFSPLPIVLQSDVADAAGDSAAAAARLREAAELQPENPRGWIALGLYYYLLDPPDMCSAYKAFNAAWTLDRLGPAGEPGGPLDVAREAVNHGACER